MTTAYIAIDGTPLCSTNLNAPEEAYTAAFNEGFYPTCCVVHEYNDPLRIHNYAVWFQSHFPNSKVTVVEGNCGQ